MNGTGHHTATSVFMATLAIAFLVYACKVSRGPVAAQGIALPDQSLTPGAVLDTDPAVVCQPSYARTHRVWHAKRATADKYGVSWSVAIDMEDDDLVPPGLGGDNANPKNHWLQPCSEWRVIGTEGLRECAAGEAFNKDQLEHEREARFRETCRTRDMLAAKEVLDEGVVFFLSGQWADEVRR